MKGLNWYQLSVRLVRKVRFNKLFAWILESFVTHHLNLSRATLRWAASKSQFSFMVLCFVSHRHDRIVHKSIFLKHSSVQNLSVYGIHDIRLVPKPTNILGLPRLSYWAPHWYSFYLSGQLGAQILFGFDNWSWHSIRNSVVFILSVKSGLRIKNIFLPLIYIGNASIWLNSLGRGLSF